MNPKGKTKPWSSPVGGASQLRKASSSQTLRMSPKSTNSRSRDTDRAEQSGGRRALEFDQRGRRDLRHRSSTSTLSRATESSFITSTSGAGTIVNISKDVSANRTVGSGQNTSGQDSNPDKPGRAPLAAISNRTSRNVPAQNLKTIQLPAKSQHVDMGLAHMYLSPQASGASGRPPTTEAHAPTPPVLPQLRKLQRQIQTLKAENDDLRSIKTTQVATIDDLRCQLRTRDAERTRLAGQMRAEAVAREDEVVRLREAAAALKEEKWTLLGRVAELEQMQQAASGEAGGAYAGSVRSGAPPPSSRRGSEAGLLSIAGYETPGSIYSGRGEGDGGPSRIPYHSASSSVVTASARSYVRRRASIAESDLTAASLAEEELDILSDQLAADHEQHGKERQAMAEQLVAVEGDLAATRRQRDRAERRSRDLEARLATQMALVRHHSIRATPAPAAPPPIPDLPVLTYAKVGLVWFDTVMSAFKYWGLSEFISQPDETLFAGTDPDREGRRLRAVVLLKRAMDDDILDDIMYLQNQKFISAPTAPSAFGGGLPQHLPPEIESPYFLFHTAAVLKRTVPTSLTDFGWLDRIGDADFEGIEGFASLVNILNRRHSQLYGTTADHYDALIPRIQENMSRRFPDLEKSLMDPGSAPKKWWHLALWMSRMVKRRQGRIAGVDEP